jgi:hypothetical protein
MEKQEFGKLFTEEANEKDATPKIATFQKHERITLEKILEMQENMSLEMYKKITTYILFCRKKNWSEGKIRRSVCRKWNIKVV